MTYGAVDTVDLVDDRARGRAVEPVEELRRCVDAGALQGLPGAGRRRAQHRLNGRVDHAGAQPVAGKSGLPFAAWRKRPVVVGDRVRVIRLGMPQQHQGRRSSLMRDPFRTRRRSCAHYSLGASLHGIATCRVRSPNLSVSGPKLAIDPGTDSPNGGERDAFIHTADWQLGMTRHFLAGEAQPRYSAARRDAVAGLGALAAESGAEFVVVAGDVFEDNQLDPRVVSTVAGSHARHRRSRVPAARQP